MKEIKKITIEGLSTNEYELPATIWLEYSNDVKQTSLNLTLENRAFEFEIFNKDVLTICNLKELNNLLEKYEITSYDALRLEVKETKKWGLKPLFINGINNVCFRVCIKEQNKQNIIILFNTNGSHEVESLYIHGIWLSEASSQKRSEF